MNTKYFKELVVTMPYGKDEFDDARKRLFERAVANAAGTDIRNVEIVSVEERQRRSAQVDVKVKIRAVDQADLDRVNEQLGSGDVLRGKIDSELVLIGMKKSTGVVVVVDEGAGGDTISGAHMVGPAPAATSAAIQLLLFAALLLSRT